MPLNDTPKIDASGIVPTLSAGPDFFTIENLPDVKSDTDDASDTGETSDSDKEKPSRGKAPRVNTVQLEPQRRSPGGFILSVCYTNLTLSS